MDNFVARENIRHFREQLETETDPATRLLLDKLVIGELDKLRRNDQLLRDVEDAIVKSKEHVHKQQALVAAMERDGRDTRAAVALLKGLCESVLVFENYR